MSQHKGVEIIILDHHGNCFWCTDDIDEAITQLRNLKALGEAKAVPRKDLFKLKNQPFTVNLEATDETKS